MIEISVWTLICWFVLGIITGIIFGYNQGNRHGYQVGWFNGSIQTEHRLMKEREKKDNDV